MSLSHEIPLIQPMLNDTDTFKIVWGHIQCRDKGQNVNMQFIHYKCPIFHISISKSDAVLAISAYRHNKVPLQMLFVSKLFIQVYTEV